MNFTLAELKDLISFGHDLGLSQLHADKLVVVYGQRAVMPASAASMPTEPQDEQSITAYYASLGKGQLKP